MSWNTYNIRKEALREVLAIADRRREESTATELLATVKSAHDAFADEADLLLDVQMLWRQKLSGQLDLMLTAGAEDLEHLTINAWRTSAEAMPGARALLDANLELPELKRALDGERELVARAAGIPWNHPDLRGQGQRIIEMAHFSGAIAA